MRVVLLGLRKMTKATGNCRAKYRIQQVWSLPTDLVLICTSWRHINRKAQACILSHIDRYHSKFRTPHGPHSNLPPIVINSVPSKGIFAVILRISCTNVSRGDLGMPLHKPLGIAAIPISLCQDRVAEWYY